jgi:hypothetical protein
MYIWRERACASVLDPDSNLPATVAACSLCVCDSCVTRVCGAFVAFLPGLFCARSFRGASSGHAAAHWPPMIRPTASLSTLSRTTFASWCGKRLFLSHVHIEPIVLPRQARDKHRETLKKRGGSPPPPAGLPHAAAWGVEIDPDWNHPQPQHVYVAR